LAVVDALFVEQVSGSLLVIVMNVLKATCWCSCESCWL